MLITLLKSKLHNARVTGANVKYEGSLGISRDLLEAVGLLPYEKVLVTNCNNGERLETYVIVEEDPGRIVLQGAAALKGKPGDRVIIMSFGRYTPEEAAEHHAKVAVLNKKNEIQDLRV